MFRRFNRLMPLPGRNKYEMLYNKSKYNFTPNLPTLSLYGDIMSYLFKDSNKYILETNLKIPYDEQWECKDFKSNKNIGGSIYKSKIPYDEQWECKDFKSNKNIGGSIYKSKIPYDEQWEVRDFYVTNKNNNKYIDKKKKDENRGFELVILNDKTITYNDYIQQLFLLDKKNSLK